MKQRIYPIGSTYIRKDGYVVRRLDGVPCERFEHLVIAEGVLSRPLPAKAEVHHANGDNSDNRPSNLVVCENHAYHFLLHVRAAAVAAGVPANWRRCPFCQTYDAPANLVLNHRNRKGDQPSFCHYDCRSKYNKEYHARKKRGAAA